MVLAFRPPGDVVPSPKDRDPDASASASADESISEEKEGELVVVEARVGRRVGVNGVSDMAIKAEGSRLWAAGTVREVGTTETASVSSVGLLIIGRKVDVRVLPPSAIEIKSPRSAAADGMAEAGIVESALVNCVEMLLSAAPSWKKLASLVMGRKDAIVEKLIGRSGFLLCPVGKIDSLP